MAYRILSFTIFFLLFSAVISLAQKKLSVEETQDFYKLIKQTKEYKTLKAQTDSVNSAMGESQMPQETRMEILKAETNGAPEDYIFYATLERRLALGIPLDRYTFCYDKRKKQIVSVKHEKTNFEVK